MWRPAYFSYTGVMTKAAHPPMTYADCLEPEARWHTVTRKTQYYVCRRPGRPARYLTVAELTEIDPRLPAVLAHLTASLMAYSVGETICRTLRFWRNHHVLRTTCTTSALAHYMETVTQVMALDDTAQIVTVRGDTIGVGPCPGHADIPLVISHGSDNRGQVAYATLEDLYPGSLARLRAGEAMGLSAQELVTYGLVSLPASTVEVTLPADVGGPV